MLDLNSINLAAVKYMKVIYIANDTNMLDGALEAFPSHVEINETHLNGDNRLVQEEDTNG